MNLRLALLVPATVLAVAVPAAPGSAVQPFCTLPVAGTVAVNENVTAMPTFPPTSIGRSTVWAVSDTPSGNGTMFSQDATVTFAEAMFGKYVQATARTGSNDYFCQTGWVQVGRIADPVATAPVESGKARKKHTLSAVLGTLPTGTGATYQWLRQKKHQTAVGIPGATGPTYKLTGKDVGKKVSVQVTYTRPGNLPTVLTSAPRKVH